MLIQEYQARWEEDFEEIRHVIAEALTGLDITIEHVGSTAVPRLAAKPIIDIDVVFSSSIDFEEVQSRLEQIGYVHNGNQGIPEREVFKRQHIARAHPILDSLSHHLYVCRAQSEELRRHLLFRDYLRTHREARQEYQELKYRIAEEARQDRKKYTELKEMQAKAFVEAVLAKSQEQNTEKLSQQVFMRDL